MPLEWHVAGVPLEWHVAGVPLEWHVAGVPLALAQTRPSLANSPLHCQSFRYSAAASSGELSPSGDEALFIRSRRIDCDRRLGITGARMYERIRNHQKLYS